LVGDEALLLAEIAPALVSRDRAAGARAIEAAATASVIIMDDGLQNPSLCKDLTIALVDARRGIGNGEVLPMGPLRARLGFQLGLVDAVVLNHSPSGHGELKSQSFQWLESQFPGPVLAASPEPQGDIDWIKTARLIAFAGIANPQRFFRLLEILGGDVAATVTLPDHHMFRQKDAERILSLAASHDAIPVTTEKDLVRLKGGHGAIGQLFAISRKLGIRLELKEGDGERLNALLGAALTRRFSDQPND
jgi:tetraacyldisaccharide 4'-kinase